MIKAFQNYVVFKTTSLSNEKVKYKGMELIRDTSYNPKEHTNISGEVVSVPVRLSSTLPISQVSKGLPSYHGASPYIYRWLSDIEQQVKVGDKIFFHFNTIVPQNIVQVDGERENRTWYIKCRYDQIYCAVRNEEIIMIGGYCLVDPDFQTWEDISIPTYSNLLGEDGKPLLKPKEQWIVTKTAPTYKYLLGFVRHVGSPVRGDRTEVKVGQKILYQKNADFMINVEGKDYFLIHQRHIYGRFEEEL